MGRLIDADELLNEMKLRCVGNCNKCIRSTFLDSDEHCGLIDEQPTAYDVDKVISKLEEEKRCRANYEIGEIAMLNKAIQIVKEGAIP